MQVSKPETEGWLGKYAHNQFDNYQLKEYNAAIEATKQKRVAIDIGANLGMMSARMVKDFEFVHAFEPLFGEHLRKNVHADNIKTYDYAVGDKPDTVTMRIGVYHSGGSNIISNESKDSNQVYKDVQVVTIDQYELNNVDFIKIDVEGYEWYVLQGCKNTIDKNKPVLLVEVKKDNPNRNDIFKFMKDFGYKFIFVGKEDCLFTL